MDALIKIIFVIISDFFKKNIKFKIFFIQFVNEHMKQ